MKEKEKLSYIESTHRIGKISTAIAIILMLSVPTVITIVYGRGVEIDFGKTLGAIITLSAIFGVVSIVEVVSYSPFLGSAGTYLSFVTGNIMNMKLPAATNALRINEVERGTDEAEVISTLAIGASSLVTTAVLFLGMLFLGKYLVPVITSPKMAPAFNNITPALTGALAAPFFIKNKRLAIPTVAAGILLYLILGQAFMGTYYSYMMMAFIIVSFLVYLVFEKIGYISETKK
ncbi:MAG: hypothetical protein GX666_13755 [Tissierellia bacterium]|nr:hypothetical protein [Tissierellia bacterium]